MAERKVIKILENTSKRQLNKFADYLSSPFFNKSEETVKIFNCFLDFYKIKETSKNFDEYVNANYKEKISSTSLDKYLSKILNHYLDFIALEKIRENPNERNLALLNALSERGEIDLFETNFNKIFKQIEKEKHSIKKAFVKFRLEETRTQFLSKNKRIRKGEKNLQNSSDALDLFYLAQKLDYAITKKLSTRQSKIKKFDYPFLEVLENEIPKTKNFYNQLIAVLYSNLKLLTVEGNEREKYFNDLVYTLTTKANEFDDEIVFNLNILVQNFAREIYKSDDVLYPFLFEFFKSQIENESIFLDGKLHAANFKNIVVAATRVKEFSWTEKFIEANKSKITPKILANEIANFSIAFNSFFLGEYDKVQNYIVKLKFKDPFYKISLKVLELMLYYEKKEFLLLDSLTNAFKVSLTPDRIDNLPEVHKLVTKSFIKYFVRLSKMNQSANKIEKKKITQLKAEVKNEKMVSVKTWLLEKCDELLLSAIG